MKTSLKGKYKSILATDSHQEVSRIAQFGSWDSVVMGFFYQEHVIGGGYLKRVRYVSSKKKTCLQTESVSLNRKWRKKGHGIHLYKHLIAHAKSCGAERVYSSNNLNHASRRMWSEKLAKIYKVIPVSRRKCPECGGTCGKKRLPKGYYIRFKGK